MCNNQWHLQSVFDCTVRHCYVEFLINYKASLSIWLDSDCSLTQWRRVQFKRELLIALFDERGILRVHLKSIERCLALGLSIPVLELRDPYVIERLLSSLIFIRALYSTESLFNQRQHVGLIDRIPWDQDY